MVRSEALRAAAIPKTATDRGDASGTTANLASSIVNRNIAVKGTSLIVSPLRRNKTGWKAHIAVRASDATLPISATHRNRKNVQRSAKHPKASVKRIAQIRLFGNSGHNFQTPDRSNGYKMGYFGREGLPGKLGRMYP